MLYLLANIRKQNWHTNAYIRVCTDNTRESTMTNAPLNYKQVPTIYNGQSEANLLDINLKFSNKVLKEKAKLSIFN